MMERYISAGEMLKGFIEKALDETSREFLFRLCKITQEEWDKAMDAFAKTIDGVELYSTEQELPLDKLGLSSRVYCRLLRQGINTIPELKALSICELRRFRGIGAAAVAEIEYAIKRFERGDSDVYQER